MECNISKSNNLPAWVVVRRVGTESDYRAYCRVYLAVFGDTLKQRIVLRMLRSEIYKRSYIWDYEGDCIGIFALKTEEHERVRAGVNFRVLYNFALIERMRGMGYGKILLSAVLSEAYKLGCDDLLLKVSVGNARALKLYEQFGFSFV